MRANLSEVAGARAPFKKYLQMGRCSSPLVFLQLFLLVKFRRRAVKGPVNVLVAILVMAVAGGVAFHEVCPSAPFL